MSAMDVGSSKPRVTDEANDAPDSPLSAFRSQVQAVEKKILDVRSLTTVLTDKQDEKLRVVDANRAAMLGREIDELRRQATTGIQQARVSLDAMQRVTIERRSHSAHDTSAATIIRIEESQHTRLLQALLAAVASLSRAEKAKDEAYNAEITRRIKTAMREADGTTISDERAKQLAQQAIEQGTENAVFQQAKDKLAQVIETRNDILKIESSMRELNDLFRQLSLLVNDQQEAMDNILVNLEHTTIDVHQGGTVLSESKPIARSGRRNMCWLMIAVFVILMFVLALIIGATLR